MLTEAYLDGSIVEFIRVGNLSVRREIWAAYLGAVRHGVGVDGAVLGLDKEIHDNFRRGEQRREQGVILFG